MASEVWADLVDHAHNSGLKVFADVFGIDSAVMMHSLNIDGFMIHAADVANEPLLQYIASLGKLVLLSAGGSSWIEIAEAVSFLKSSGADSIVLMHGFQGYPTALANASLRRIELLRMKYDLKIGFASHVDGGSMESVTLPLLAAASGADVLEVHLTLDREKKGLDYYSSLNPDNFAEMVRSIRCMESAFGERSLKMSEEEIEYRLRHRKWMVATRDIDAGTILQAGDVALKRVENPPHGRPVSFDMAVGHKTTCPISRYSPIKLGDLQMKVAATLACRAESTRLYGKPMQLVGARPIIQHLVDRLRQAKSIDEIVLAISDGPSSSVFVDFAEKQGLRYVVGPEKDVLGRLIMAADSVQADIVLRTTTENPYIYYENIDDLIRMHIENNADLTVTEKLPLGAFLEVITLNSLKTAHMYGEDRHRSEFCTLFIAENPDIFTIQKILPPQKLQRPEIRLTVDTPYDLILVRTIWDALNKGGHIITIEEIIDYLDLHPDIAGINRGEKTLYLWK